MSITIELTPEEETKLRAVAEKGGVSPDECARQVLTANLATETPEDRTLELFARWDAEDATDDPEELARRNREWEEFKSNINATRAAAGARLIYP